MSAEIGGMVAGGLLRRGDRDLPRGPAGAAGQDQEGRPGRRRGLEAAARQRPHAALELWRLSRPDRRRRSWRAPHDGARAQIRPAVFPRHCRRPDGLCRAAHARRDREASRRHVTASRTSWRTTASRTSPITVAIDVTVSGDEHRRRLSRLLAAGEGADQRHARRRHWRGL